MTRRADLKRLITIQTRRLQKLKEKKAQKGVNADADLLIEIEDTETELETWQAELDQSEANPELDKPVADSPSAGQELDSYLARAVTTFQERMTQQVARTYTTPTEPYKFLYAFDIEDANIFFGRDAAVDALYRTMLRDRLTILHAKSGAGKTSLLNAGLSPRLIGEGRLPVYARAYDDPVLAIKRAIVPPSQAAWPNSLAQLNLYDFLSSVCAHLNRPAQELVIILDQFEEFFIFWPEPDHRRPFIDALADCYDDKALPVRFIIALRKDYYSDLADFQRRIPTMFNNEVRLAAMTRGEAQTAITGPVAKIGRPATYEPELLDLLLADLTRGGVELPHLQIICTKLYETLSSSETTITLAAYERLGQAPGILSSYLNQVLDRLPHQEGHLARETLKTLVSSEATKRVLSDTTLAARVRVTLKVLNPLLKGLVNARLLRRLESGGEPSYEIAHEYLIEEIRVWLDVADLEFKQAEELLAREVQSWQAHGTLIPRDRLELLYTYREKFSDLSEEACDCLMASALQANFEIESWAEILGHKVEKSLLGGVNDTRDNVRRAALRSLGLVWSFVEVSDLGSEDRKVRNAAARTLGESADPRGVEPLIGTLRDGNHYTRWAAVKSLGQIGDPRGVEALIGVLGDRNNKVRRAAAEALGHLGDPRGLEALIGALGDKVTNVRMAAAGALVKLGDVAIKPLIAALGDEELKVRWAVADALGQLGDVAIEPLVSALRDENKDVRRTVVDALGKLGDPRGVEPLISALGDEEWSVRQAATKALVKLGDVAIEPLVSALRDENKDVRRAVVDALRQLGDIAVEPLVSALRDENKDVRRAVADALRQLGDIAIEPLVSALRDENKDVRRTVVETLGKFGVPWIVEPLITALGDVGGDVRQAATKALVKLGDSAVEPLISALDDEDRLVRYSAAGTLKQIGTPKALEAIKQRDW